MVGRTPRDGFPRALGKLYDYLDTQIAPVVTGSVFYVDPTSGDDNNSGLSYATGKATMAAALALCTANNGDVVVRMKGTESVAETIAFDVAGVTVVAQTYGAPQAGISGENFMSYNADVAGGPAALVTAPTRFLGVGFAASDVSEEACQVYGTGGFSGGSVSFEKCRFPLWNGALACSLRLRGGAQTNVEDCEFDGLFPLNATGWATGPIIQDDDGVASVPFYNTIVGNRFRGMASGNHAITNAAAAVELLIARNELGLQGKLLDEGGLASTGSVFDNWTNRADQAAAFSNIGSTNLNISGNHYNE